MIYFVSNLLKMLEYVFLMLMIVIAFMYVRNHPVVKHYTNYRREREELVKRHKRLYKSRSELMVSI